jgi:hypothetical protein
MNEGQMSRARYQYLGFEVRPYIASKKRLNSIMVALEKEFM